MGRASLGSRGLWKLHEDGATGGAHEARKRTGRNAGGGGAGHATAIATLRSGGGGHAQRGGRGQSTLTS
jgi:hypothetical protein